MSRPQWSWSGASVLILAICLGVGWSTAIVFSASSRTPPITDTTKDLLSTIGGVLAGAVTAYIGGQVALARRRQDDEHVSAHGASAPSAVKSAHGASATTAVKKTHEDDEP